MSSSFETVARSRPFGLADVILIAAVTIVSVVALLLTAGFGTEATVADVYVDGKIVRTLSLSVDGSYVIDCENGANTVTVSGGKVSVTEADCPDGTCKGFPPTNQTNGRIICAPHKLVVVVRGGDDGVDVVS